MKTERKTLDDIIRTSIKSFLSAAFVAVAFTALGPAARATVIQTTYRIMNNGPADFGSGNHSGGGPVSNAAITYDWSTASGSLVVTGRVRGTLYWDSFTGGCARLSIRFRNANHANIGFRTRDECGPGGNANSSENQTPVDEIFSSGAHLEYIVLTVAEVRNGVEVNPSSITISQVSQKAFRVLVENGKADFGASDPPGHHFGRPDKGGRIIFGRSANGTVLSLVDGVLYYDAFDDDSCARTEVDWLSSRRPTPEVLENFPALNCGPGGDANLAANQFFILRDPAFSSLEQIRLTVQDTARPTEAVLLHYGFAGQAGDFEVEPAEAVAAAGVPINYALTWTVPGPLNWHDIDSLGLRLTDGPEVILQVRLEEAGNLISVFNEATGRFGSGFPAGSNKRLQTRYAALDLGGTTVGPVNSALGTGPDSPAVRLNLALRFKPPAAGKTYQVEVSARDDLGNEDPFAVAGALTVY